MNDLINDLAKEHRPFTPMENFPRFFGKWVALSLLLVAFSWYLFPVRANLSELSVDAIFYVENFFWAMLSVCGGIALYYNTFPDSRNALFANACVFLLSALFMLTFYHNGYNLSFGEAAGEMDLWRGRCGFIILILSVLHTGILVYWARKGASPRPELSGLWAAMSAAALGCLLMQVVCAHDNSLHLLIWHFLPLGLVCFAAQRFTSRWLKW